MPIHGPTKSIHRSPSLLAGSCPPLDLAAHLLSAGSAASTLLPGGSAIKGLHPVGSRCRGSATVGSHHRGSTSARSKGREHATDVGCHGGGACGSMPHPCVSRDGGPLSEERSGRGGGAPFGRGQVTVGHCGGGACGHLPQPFMSQGYGALPEESKACGGRAPSRERPGRGGAPLDLRVRAQRDGWDTRHRDRRGGEERWGGICGGAPLGGHRARGQAVVVEGRHWVLAEEVREGRG